MSLGPDPEGMWKDIQPRLRNQLSSAVYGTWVADAQPVSYRDGVLTIGVGNTYAREMLLGLHEIPLAASQLLGRDVRLQVIVAGVVTPDRETSPNSQPVGKATASPPVGPPTSDEVSIGQVYLSQYDEIVRPERVISVPRYYLRWIPYLGADLAWIPIGFRQVAYFRGLAFEEGDLFRCSYRELALWSGMSERNLYRKVNDPRLGWFIQRTDQGAEWTIGEDSIPHRNSSEWRVVMSMPLTPADRRSLRSFIEGQVRAGASPEQVLQASYQSPIEDLLPWPKDGQIPEMAGEPMGVQQVVEVALGGEVSRPSLRRQIDALAFRIAGYGDPMAITHYFVRALLPNLGSGRGWLVQWLRALDDAQRSRGKVLVQGSYSVLAGRLGVYERTIRRWFGEASTASGALGHYLRSEGILKHSDGSTDLLVHIQRDEPIEEAAGKAGGHSVSIQSSQDGHLDRIGEGGRDGHSVSIEPKPDGRPVRIEEREEGQPDTIASQAAGQPVRIEEAGEAVRLSALKGGGGLPDSSSSSRESCNTFNPATSTKSGQSGSNEGAENGGWDLERLLAQASVHPSLRRQLQGASAVAWVSWLLYWASPAAAKLSDPIGHAISRLKEAPDVPMGGAFERLAGLGPNGLEELIVPGIVDPWGWGHPSNDDWDDVMRDAPKERVRRLVDLLGLDLSAWGGAVEEDDDEQQR